MLNMNAEQALKPFDVVFYKNNSRCPYKPPDRTLYGVGCEKNQCHAAMMDKINMQTMDPNRSPEIVMAEAKEFLEEYYRDEYSGEGDRKNAFELRWNQVTKEIKEKGYYFQTYEELQYGVRLSWRNCSRCIMRIQWRNIDVIDRRGPNAEFGKEIRNKFVFQNCVEHIRGAVQKQSDGSKVIKTRMTIFPQILPGQKTGCKIWNPQLTRFAGYKQADGTILGDPAQEELTELLVKLGWNPENSIKNEDSVTAPKRTAFDLLPLMVHTEASLADEGVLIEELPEDCKIIVPIVHPEYPEFEQLGIKWQGFATLSNLVLDIGGIQYPCTPFNGWYMGTEIASRNLADEQRYNILPEVARALKIKMTENSDLWRDKTLLELNRAVLFSYQQKERITIIDHHTASDSFVRFHKKEMEERGFCPADWVWLVPPLGGSLNSVFHQEMINFYIKPNFLPPSHTIKQLLKYTEEKGKLLSYNSKQSSNESNSVNLKNLTNPKPIIEKLDSKRPIQILIYFGSETGLSEYFATRIHRILKDNQNEGYEICELMNTCPIALEKLNINENLLNIPEKRETVLIIVTSTFGSGGPPRNAEKFHKALTEICQKKRENTIKTSLEHIKLFLLGNGSSSYASFNNFSKLIKENMKILGVDVSIYEEADEIKDPESSVEIFMKKIGEQLKISLLKNPFRQADSQGSILDYKISLSKMPFELEGHVDQSKMETTAPTNLVSTLISKEAIIMENTCREVLLMKFSVNPREAVPESALPLYKEGDHLAIYPINADEEVNKILEFYNLDGDNYLKLQASNLIKESNKKDIPIFLSSGKNKIRGILTNFVDLSAAPSYKFIKSAALYALPGTRDRAILDYYGIEIPIYEKWVKDENPSIITFFQNFRSLPNRFPFHEFLLQCKIIKPRVYSIASSPETHPNEVHILTRSAYLDTKYLTPEGKTETKSRRGLCTGYLWNLKLGNSLKIGINQFPQFSLPENLMNGQPIIMIASGTGIAPFRALWNTIIARSANINPQLLQPTIVLFYGCRNASEHCLMSEMKYILHNEKINIRIFVSYSRAENLQADSNEPFTETVLKIGLNSMAVRAPRDHVNKAIKSEAKFLFNLITNCEAKIFVCGMPEMEKAVSKEFEDILSEEKFKSITLAGNYVVDVF